jgi:quercetin dioxygenase-like cupin family protein
MDRIVADAGAGRNGHPARQVPGADAGYRSPPEVPPMPESALFVADLAAVAPHVERGIHSQTLYDGPDLRLVLFAFAPGEELSEHTAARPAVVHVLDGEGEASLGGEPHALVPGTWFRMPARMPHSIRARTPLRMALYLLPEGA